VADYALGFRDVGQEQASVEADLSGTLPLWLEGLLIRNGPGQWSAGAELLRHWFDGFALLHQFRINGGKVYYQSRFLRTPDKLEADQHGRVMRPSFASDPCRRLFQKVMTVFVSDVGANANVNITRWGDRFLAMTETPMAVEFEPDTLHTIGLFDYQRDGLPGQITSAHPLHQEGHLYNFTVKMGAKTRYLGYRLPVAGSREVFATCPTRAPAYIHSFGLSHQEMILVEGPLLANRQQLLLRTKPYIDCYEWHPDRGTRLCLLNLKGGRVEYARGPTMFVFHHVNSFYQDGQLLVDVLAYPDSSVIDLLSMDNLRSGREIPMPKLTRLMVDRQNGTFESTTLSDRGLELPRISPGFQGREYRWVYGVTREDSPFYNALTKLDQCTGQTQVWQQDHCFAGEPVPVLQTGQTQEDSGVVLSVVLDSRQQRSFLLVLDARSFLEIARAYIPAIVPFGFHGAYYDHSVFDRT